MNQVEVKRKQIQFFAYALAGINVWIFGKKLGNNGLSYGGFAGVCIFLDPYGKEHSGPDGEASSRKKCQGTI